MATPKIGVPPKPVRGGHGIYWIIGLGTLAVTLLTGWAPPVAAAFSHVTDRISNGIRARRELKTRTDWYRVQIAKTLGMHPEDVTTKDFQKAAEINPLLGKAYREVTRKQSDDNRVSLAASAVVAVVPWGAAGKTTYELAREGTSLATTAKIAGGSTAAGLVAGLFSKNTVNPQDVIEVIHSKMLEAREKGEDPRKAVPPNLVFMLRISQDEQFAAQLQQTYGKPFHKMSDAEQNFVMQKFPALANASASEAYAVGTGILPTQELMAASPNLNGMAGRFQASTSSGSFRQRVEAERQAQAMNTMGPAV